jgi:hypothetical protein
MDESSERVAPPWSVAPTMKERNAVQRVVTSLLDELAPERVLSRGERVHGTIEQHRTPTGCVLQAATAAISVSWFVDGNTHDTPGELHVLVWRGVVARRGQPRKKEGAVITKQLVLEPIAGPNGDYLWRAADATQYSTATLTAHCIALLGEQMDAIP